MRAAGEDEAAHCVEQILQGVHAVDAADEGAGRQEAPLVPPHLPAPDQIARLAPNRLQVLHLLGKKPPQCACLAAWLV